MQHTAPEFLLDDIRSRSLTVGKGYVPLADPEIELMVFGSVARRCLLLAERIGLHLTPGGALSPEKNTLRLQTRMAEIQDSLVAECARWGYRTPQNWLAAADEIYRNLFPGRTDQLLGYLRQKGWYVISDLPDR